MPLETSDFPYEVQVAFFVFSFLEDRYEGMSGQYMGKTWNNLEFLLNLYEVQEPRTIIYIMKLWEVLLVNYRSEKAARKHKAEEKRSSGGGKQFTHKVQG
jgi:hypothetical protein|tara:strand:- start:3382 stop:3681 length:300 start_codon:yes stop_codon:yes gene_type:complete